MIAFRPQFSRCLLLFGIAASAPLLADGRHAEADDVIEVTGHYDNGVGTSDTASQGYITPKLIEDGSVQSRSTPLTNLRIAYKLDKNLRLALDVFNLFKRQASDIDYFYASQLRGEAAPVNDVHFHPVEPRSLRLTVSANF